MLQSRDLVDLANTSMPFGKYRGRLLIALPEDYLLWFARRGWPAGRLGQLLELALEVRSNDLTGLIEPLRKGGVIPSPPGSPAGEHP